MKKGRKVVLRVGGIVLFTGIVLFIAWGWRALSFPSYETVGRTPKADYAFKGMASPRESEILAFKALKAGVLWVDEFIVHEGVGVAFGPFGRFAVLEPSRAGYPGWDLVSTGVWEGDHSDFDFENIKVRETTTVLTR